MGGGVKVFSQLGKGSCFQVELKLEKSQLAHRVMPKVNIAKLNFLVVDDNETNREVLKGQLEHWGGQVRLFSAGQDLLNYLDDKPKNEKYDIAFLDMQMPEMDGAELGKRIRELLSSEQLKLIMMTSMGCRGDIEYFADIGFDAYFPKPATTSDLFHAISVVSEGGGVLAQAKPLLTHHYLQTIVSTESILESPGKTVVDKVEELSGQTSLANQAVNCYKILLVEDNLINQEVALGLLELLGLTADLAHSGVEALNLLAANEDDQQYDIVFMDCQMPIMDGYEATKTIRKAIGKNYQAIPIIAMTANAMKGDREKCLEAGMNDYLAKPVSIEGFQRIFKQWLSQENHNCWQSEPILKRLGGKKELLVSLLLLFKQNSKSWLQELSYLASLSPRDEAKWLKVIARIKLNATTLGAEEFVGLLDDFASDESIEVELMHSYQSLIAAIDHYLEQNR